MKKLSIFSIKSFAGPLVATFFISMFMLVMQFLWKYIDDLMGKGLDTWIVLELLFYVSASLLPLALPLAILLASIITVGNLGEKNELTALKSSGLSLYRILRPLTYVVVLIAIGTFYFSNYVIPVANLKWHSIIWDIQQTKLTAFLKPGSYINEIEGYSIKINSGDENKIKEITIHDHTDKKVLKTITAESGELFKSKEGDILFLKLENGEVIEELAHFRSNNKAVKKSDTYRPARKSTFQSAAYKMSLEGFQMNKTEDDLFKNEYEMLNVFQINTLIDSLQQDYKGVSENFLRTVKNDHGYFQAVNFEPPKSVKDDKDLIDTLKNEVVYLDSISESQLIIALNQAHDKLLKKQRQLTGQLDFEAARMNNLNRFQTEFHRKFSLSFTIIILFFIGAPLGAIVKKGGFGAPVVIAALLFMVYFVLISLGDGMVKSGVLTPFLGMWGPTFVLAPFAIILMYSAANDRSVLKVGGLFSKFKKKK